MVEEPAALVNPRKPPRDWTGGERPSFQMIPLVDSPHGCGELGFFARQVVKLIHVHRSPEADHSNVRGVSERERVNDAPGQPFRLEMVSFAPRQELGGEPHPAVAAPRLSWGRRFGRHPFLAPARGRAPFQADPFPVPLLIRATASLQHLCRLRSSRRRVTFFAFNARTFRLRRRRAFNLPPFVWGGTNLRFQPDPCISRTTPPRL